MSNLIKKRRSIRSYKDKKVGKKLIRELLELANLAPTAAGLENRHFIVIDDQKIKEKLFEAGCKQEHILKAPVIVAVTTNTKGFFSKKGLLKINDEVWLMDLWGATQKKYKGVKRFHRNYEVWKRLYPLQDADTAGTTLLLAATDKGLSSCWIGAFDFEAVENILKIPEGWKIIALIALGYKKDPPYPQKRTKIDKLVHWNKW